MKKGIVTGLVCMVLAISVTGTSCSASVRTLNEILDWDSAQQIYSLDGEKVTLKNVVVNGQHGNYLTVASLETVTTVEVIQKKVNPDVTVRKTVDVTGTVKTTNGRCQIVDADVTVVSDERLAVYVTTGMKRQSGFDSYGRTYSGVLATDVPLRVLSYNGTTELKEGVDTTITVAYQGEDYDDPWYWLDLIIWGDTDQETRDYLNAFLFGNNTGSVVTWDDPFKYEASHSEVPADWEGVTEGMYIKGLFHFYYDDVLNPDFGTMFYLDNICIPSLEGYELYNEDTDMTKLLDGLSEAYWNGDDEKSAYTDHLQYVVYQGDVVDRATTEEWGSNPETTDNQDFLDYLENMELAEYDDVYFRVCASRYEMLIIDSEIKDGETIPVGYLNYVWRDFVDEEDEETTYCEYMVFYTEEAYNEYMNNGFQYDPDTDEDMERLGTYKYPWFYAIPALYDLADNGYSTGFHDNGEATRVVGEETVKGKEYLVNDINLIDCLWDATAGMRFDYSFNVADSYNYEVADIFYAPENNYLYIDMDRSTGWYYYTTNEDELFWSTINWYNDITIGDNTIGNGIVTGSTAEA